MMEGDRLRVLCLHGYGQSSGVFERRLEDVLAKLRISTEMGEALQLVYADAPVELPREGGDEVAMRCWYPMADGDATLSAEDTERAVSGLRCALREHAPLAGVFAFSQGASLLSLVSAEDLAGIQFIVCAGGGVQRTRARRADAAKHAVPSLHWAGRLDGVVPVDASARLCSEFFEGGRLEEHAHGHIFPSRREDVDVLGAFISEVIQRNRSEDVRDEALAVRSIFGDDEDDEGEEEQGGEGTRTIRVAVRSHDERLDIELALALPMCYPYAPPSISLRPLHVGVYTQSGLRHLEATAQRVALANAGSATTFEVATALGQEISEAFHVDGSGTAAARDDSAARGGAAGADGGEEEETVDEDEIIRAATEDAAEYAFRAGPYRSRRKGKCWSFVVGLVGKPSAGKSSFFNAAKYPTEAEARVGAFPCVHGTRSDGDAALCVLRLN